MVTIVIILNCSIALFCFYVAWQIWRLRFALARTTDALVIAERSTYQVLSQGPGAIGQQQRGVTQLRANYRLLELRLLQVQKVLALLGMGQFAWRWYWQRQQQSRSLQSPSLGQGARPQQLRKITLRSEK